MKREIFSFELDLCTCSSDPPVTLRCSFPFQSNVQKYKSTPVATFANSLTIIMLFLYFSKNEMKSRGGGSEFFMCEIPYLRIFFGPLSSHGGIPVYLSCGLYIEITFPGHLELILKYIVQVTWSYSWAAPTNLRKLRLYTQVCNLELYAQIFLFRSLDSGSKSRTLSTCFHLELYTHVCNLKLYAQVFYLELYTQVCNLELYAQAFDLEL